MQITCTRKIFDTAHRSAYYTNAWSTGCKKRPLPRAVHCLFIIWSFYASLSQFQYCTVGKCRDTRNGRQGSCSILVTDTPIKSTGLPRIILLCSVVLQWCGIDRWYTGPYPSEDKLGVCPLPTKSFHKVFKFGKS